MGEEYDLNSTVTATSFSRNENSVPQSIMEYPIEVSYQEE